MATHHQKIMIAHPGRHAAARGPGIERNIFPDDVMIPDGELAGLSLVLEILRHRSHTGELKNGITFSQGCPTFNHYMGFDPRAFADLDASSDDRARTNLDILVQFRGPVQHGGLANLSHMLTHSARAALYSISISIAELSAWASNLLSTEATPCIVPNVPAPLSRVHAPFPPLRISDIFFSNCRTEFHNLGNWGKSVITFNHS